jgi:hypothetical protein
MTKFEIEEKIVAMLKTVFDPEIPVNVYDKLDERCGDGIDADAQALVPDSGIRADK